MEAGSKKFLDFSETFLGVAEFHSFYQGVQSTKKNSEMLDSLPLIEEIITVEEDIQSITLQNTKTSLEIKKKNLTSLKDKVQDLVTHVNKNLKFLETQKEPVSNALISKTRQKEDYLVCSDPEKTVQLVQCLSDAINTLGQPLKPLPDRVELEKVVLACENDLLATANIEKEHQELYILLKNAASGLKKVADD